MNINTDHPCDPRNYRKGRRDTIKYIVIHYVGATGSALDNVKYYGSSDVGASAHFYVGHASENGAVYQSVDPKDCAWHCGHDPGGKYYHPECRNDNAIGIEMCTHKNANGVWYFDEITVTKAIELTRELMEKYGIDTDHIIRHYDVTHKTCPAPYVLNAQAWEAFISAVSGANIEEYTEVNDIVWELAHRGIVLDSDGMVEEMSADTDGRLYWLGRKLVQYIRTHEGAAKQELEEYTEIYDIVWDLNFREIVLDMEGMEAQMREEPDGRLYWLARKGLQYLRVRD